MQQNLAEESVPELPNLSKEKPEHFHLPTCINKVAFILKHSSFEVMTSYVLKSNMEDQQHSHINKKMETTYLTTMWTTESRQT